MSITEKTREIYHAQHARVAGDEAAMMRFINMFTHQYFGLDQTFFSTAKAIDVGCGNTGKLLIALFKLGCRNITGLELGEAFIAATQPVLEKYGVAGVTLTPGSVLDLPFEDRSFDFVACHGVLVHLASLAEVERGFAELSRITKPGGYLYTVFGCVGGLMETAIIPALRSYYLNNAEFRNLIDNLDPRDFRHLLGLAESGILVHEGEAVPLTRFESLFDVDFCVTFQNLIQAPVRLACDEGMIRELYSRGGFKAPLRLRRYVMRKNIRRFFAPLHYEREDRLVRMIYGSGNLEFLAQRVG